MKSIALIALSTLAAGQPFLSSRSTPHGSAFSRRHKVKRLPNFLSTSQPAVIGQGTATAGEGCTLWMTPSPGDSCLSIITYSPGLSLEDFLDLNPSLDASCSGLQVGTGYCIDTIDDHTESASNTDTGSSGGARQLVSTKKVSCKTKPSLTSNAPKITATDKIIPDKTASASTSKSTGTSGKTSGLLNVDDPVCGESDPSKQTTMESGPNGSENWLNCGISKSNVNSGWTPPNVTMDQIVYQELDEGGIFSACKPYFPLFKAAEKAHGIPAIFFAAFAMQESTCNADASGDDGAAYGLMQITSDKCGGAPGGDCADPAYNVRTGAEYFATVLEASGNNPLVAVGQYNGWTPGLSFAKATANQAPGSCCECQQNLDYMHQFFNAWIQNLDGQKFKNYDNLAMCAWHS